jgi:predicted RNA-binding Zn ribbon-like protein
MLAGDRALDLANTLHWRGDRMVDFVPDYESLVRWSAPADLLDREEVDPLLRRAEAQAQATIAIHRKWAQCREAFRTMLSASLGRDGTEEDANDSRYHLTDILSHILGGVQIADLAQSRDVMRASRSLELPLFRSALAILTFTTLPPKGTARMCEGNPCGGFFLDDSRSKPRRWCSMETCGNRAKVRQHRLRGASAGQSG